MKIPRPPFFRWPDPSPVLALIGSRVNGYTLLSGNTAHIKNHAVLKYRYNAAFKELAWNPARDFIVSQ
jgi:hypothetical protein